MSTSPAASQPQRVPHIVMGLWALAAAITVATGIGLRLQLWTPATSGLETYLRLYESHLLWAVVGLSLPLPLVLVIITHGVTGLTVSRSLLVSALLAHGVATLLLVTAPFIFQGSAFGLSSVLLMALGLVLYALALWVPNLRQDEPSRTVALTGGNGRDGPRSAGAASPMWSGKRIATSVPLWAMTVSSLGLVTLVVPEVCAVLFSDLVDEVDSAGVLASLRGVLMWVVVAPATLALLWVLLKRGLAASGTRTRDASSTAMLGLGIVLLIAFAAALTTWLMVECGEAGLHLADSYWNVGVAHLLLGGSAFVLVAWWLWPRYTTAMRAWFLIVSGLALLVASSLDLVLGLHGMPARYHTYLEELQGDHVAAGFVWFTFVGLCLVSLLFTSRGPDPSRMENNF